jgi:hypothetical protein
MKFLNSEIIRNQVLLKSYKIPEFRNNLTFFLLIILKSGKKFHFITTGKYVVSENGGSPARRKAVSGVAARRA